MTDDEYQRIKDHEKARLRAKKRLRKTMKTLKRNERVQEVVRSMSDTAGRLLRDSTALIDDLRTEVARKTARLSVALDPSDVDASRTDETRPESVDDDLADDVEAEDRRARAEALVRQMKAQSRRSKRRTSLGSKADSAASASASESPAPEAASEDTGDASDALPERTIGRMRDATRRDASED